MKTPVFLTFGIILIDLLITLLILLSMFQNIDDCMSLLNDIFIQLIITISGLFTFGYFITVKMEEIIRIQKIPATIVGILGLLLILICGILLSSLITFLISGISEINKGFDINYVLYDYFIIPQVLTLVFALIPTIITGALLGYLIKLN